MGPTSNPHVVEVESEVASGKLLIVVDFTNLSEPHREALDQAMFAEKVRKTIFGRRNQLHPEPEAAEGATEHYTERYIVFNDSSSFILRVTLVFPVKIVMFERAIWIEEAVTNAVAWLLRTLMVNGPYPADH